MAYLNWHNGQIDNEPKLDMNKQKISPAEVAKHNKPDDCWVVINGYVYDLTRFLPNHPGGQDVIKFNAGKMSLLFLNHYMLLMSSISI